MRNFFKLFLFALLLVSACKKDKKTSLIAGTVLLSKIIDNNPLSATYGLALVQLTYNGKRLATETHYNETILGAVNTSYSEKETFNYDSQGNLTGTIISDNDPAYAGDVKSAITVSGGNITEIIFYKAGNVPDTDNLLTYQDGNLVSWSSYNYPASPLTLTATNNYTYDSNNNNIKQVNTRSAYYVTTIANDTFDNQKNVVNALPFWAYFVINPQTAKTYFPTIPGTNNMLTSYVTLPEFGAYGYSENYTYSAYNYPVTVTGSLGSDAPPYKYEYIVAP